METGKLTNKNPMKNAVRIALAREQAEELMNKRQFQKELKYEFDRRNSDFILLTNSSKVMKAYVAMVSNRDTDNFINKHQ